MEPNRQFRDQWLFTPAQLVSLVLVLLSLVGASGCVSKIRARLSSHVQCEPIEAFVKPPSTYAYGGARMGVFYASVPNYATSAEQEITPIYVDELLRSNVFSKVVLIPRSARTVDEAIWWGRHEKCDLVMESEILYLLSGSGSMPTELDMRIRILDMRTGAVVWDLKQKAFSKPGSDVDLFWHTLAAHPAQQYRVLAKALAEQLSGFLASPL